MLHLAAFLGLTRARFGHVPVALYCHENQLTYPCPPEEKRDLTYGMMNWLSMLAADCVLFNSAYHLGDWFDEIPRLLKHFPDHRHVHRVPEVRAKSEVLPVGCDLARLDRAMHSRDRASGPLVLWNQRWEYDKDPATFFRALDVLAEEGVSFRVALAGSNVRQMPDEFEAARERLGGRVVHYGRADANTYVRLLWEADIVVSTAIHEFFGVAIVEAMYCGCYPVLPRRLAYPEVLPTEYHAECLYDGFDGLVGRLRWTLADVDQARQRSAGLHEAMARYDWGAIVHRYDETMERVREEGLVRSSCPGQVDPP
jgi:glycosyltransferase involved in cell wall biosynthesis